MAIDCRIMAWDVALGIALRLGLVRGMVRMGTFGMDDIEDAGDILLFTTTALACIVVAVVAVTEVETKMNFMDFFDFGVSG